MESLDAAAAISQRAIVVALEISLPLLAVGLAVGLVVSVFQAMTQIQEQTLAFIPKLLGVAAALFLLLPRLLDAAAAYMRQAIDELGRLGGT